MHYRLADARIHYSFIWHTGILKRIGISQFWFQQVNRQPFLYNSWKFGEICISDPGVLGERICTDGVDNCYHAKFTYVRYGMGLLGTQVISK